jgi:predicted metal-dependent enzyme (double-stranded beta helix superfamily)
VSRAPNLRRLRDFVGEFGARIERADGEPRILEVGGVLLKDLVSHDDWLPMDYAQPDPHRYRQYLLHCDSLERFSVVSFVWGPGQATPVHDHTVWGLVGVLRGAELSQAYREHGGRIIPDGPVHRLSAGDVEAVSPTIGDIHRVTNAHDDRTSISIHIYGANIGAATRHTYDEAGRARPFISGYANTRVPNLWDASTETTS